MNIIKSTYQDKNIIWKFISNETNENESQIEATEIHAKNIQNKKRITTKKLTKHTLQRKMQKTVYYRGKLFDDFKLMIVDLTSNQDSEESKILSSSFVLSR